MVYAYKTVNNETIMLVVTPVGLDDCMLRVSVKSFCSLRLSHLYSELCVVVGNDTGRWRSFPYWCGVGARVMSDEW